MKKTAIIISKNDLAGMNIAKFLKDKSLKGINAELYIKDKNSIYLENIDQEISADQFIFATKHESKSGIPSLSVHSPGNWGAADLGGKEKNLTICPASLIKNAYLGLKTTDLSYEPIIEATHHGPFLKKPAMFIEIGSTKERWEDKKAGEFIANTIIKTLKNTKRYQAVIGIGGLHTTPELSKINIKTEEYALSHVCPKYNLQNLTKEILEQAIQKTQEEVKFILIDYKGLGKEKQRILEILKNLKIPYKRTDKISAQC